MDKSVGALIAIGVAVAVGTAVRLNVNNSIAGADRERAEAARQQVAAEKARRLAGEDPYTQVHELVDYKVTIKFPAKPTGTQTVRVGLNPATDHDWELTWPEGARYVVRSRNDMEPIDKGGAVVDAHRKRQVERNRKEHRGTPEEWVLDPETNFLFQGAFPATSFTYQYTKPATNANPEEVRHGRVLIVKFRYDVCHVQFDGPPEFFTSAGTTQFFQSFECTPKTPRGAGLK